MRWEDKSVALTAEGRALTEANGVLQLQLAAQAAAVSLNLWDQLQQAHLDASSIDWLAMNTALASKFYDQSVATTSAYISAYRTAEIGTDASPIVTPAFDSALTAQILLVAGPIRVKNLVASGMSGSAALAAARNGFAGMMRRQVLMGGRETIDLTTSHDQQAIGWRRVSDGNPCAFCAMLCSRGPVYRSRASAGDDPVAGDGMHFHSHCGCHAEIVYGEWIPTKQEQGFIDTYNQAARQANAAGFARTQESVLPRMRANGDFRDSPSVRNTRTTQSGQDG
ncbi:hypothetical protein [Curtobacterium sp. MCBD17_003]|uniref:VG15 protein n=1 Tax=Curtobacterium sp. MCBD17_003 TaxID=2175667 RepID=UPI0024DFD6B2|nr:hypothetical protein [Curtobacterium sp. MCBD17_003]WIE54222.1 hypothetical protein DEI88_014020 [Curtobacterium sp. MCBD17_003]